jgi:hypothetical protein
MDVKCEKEGKKGGKSMFGKKATLHWISKLRHLRKDGPSMGNGGFSRGRNNKSYFKFHMKKGVPLIY